MCGIAGFVNKFAAPKKSEIVQDMMDMIIHRGPNSSGKFVDEGAALGFRRLSIIDLEGGTQPIFNEDESLVITFNGEIYNFQKLREELIAKGHQFSTRTDTEVILHGYEEYGVDIVKKIRGMFAFVIWDRNKQELFGARDHFGIKPLYYAQMNGTFMYGSEIKSFLKHPDFQKELNKEALKPFLTFQYPAIEETFFKGVFRMTEGHYFTYKDGKLDIKQYWDMVPNEKPYKIGEAIDAIDEAVLESIDAHRFADVEVGSFLSSGVDSSYVASVLKPHHTYSIGFGEKTWNESSEAKALCDILGLENTSRTIEGDEAFEAFPAIQYHLDEPDSNPSCVPLYFLAELAARDVRVVMSGEGADELFGGYQSYGFYSNSKPIRVAAEVLKKLPKRSRHWLGRKFKQAKFKGSYHLYTSLAPAEDFFIGHARIFEPAEADGILTPDYQSCESVESIMNRQFKKTEGFSELRKMQYADVHQWMPKDILLKADKMSMAHSLELRVPLLDVKLMDLAQTIPTKHLLNEHNTKYAFREAAKRHVPQEWSSRPKLGFPVPIKDWLRDEKYYSAVKQAFEKDYVAEFFQQDAILQLLEDNYQGKVEAQRKVWSIYTFLTWYDVYFKGAL